MIVSCGEARARFECYGNDALPSEERRAIRAHLADCPDCRQSAISSDPSLLFATAPAEQVSTEETAAILASVRSAIAVRAAERRVGRRGNRSIVAAAAAVVALLAILVARPGDHSEHARPPMAGPGQARAAAPEPAPFSPVAEPRPVTKFPADATVYDWNPGGGKPRVVWIVDRSLDI